MKEIYKTSCRIDSSKNNTHVKFGFTLDESYEKMVISTSYDPKYEYDEEKCLKLMRKSVEVQAPECEFSDNDLRMNIPLTNHIGWSIDSPIYGWIGTRHKHNPNQVHTISKEVSSYGFMPCTIDKGLWCVTASINAMVTEYIDITIVVEVE